MRGISLYVMAFFYIVAGINHFISPGVYKRIVPPYVPWHLAMVYISGIAEIVGGILLFPVSTRVLGAWFIIALLVAVFPANIQMALDYYHRHSPYTWLTILRLPLQILLIGWAWTFTRTGLI